MCCCFSPLPLRGLGLVPCLSFRSLSGQPCRRSSFFPSVPCPGSPAAVLRSSLSFLVLASRVSSLFLPSLFKKTFCCLKEKHFPPSVPCLSCLVSLLFSPPVPCPGSPAALRSGGRSFAPALVGCLSGSGRRLRLPVPLPSPVRFSLLLPGRLASRRSSPSLFRRLPRLAGRGLLLVRCSSSLRRLVLPLPGRSLLRLALLRLVRAVVRRRRRRRRPGCVGRLRLLLRLLFRRWRRL